MILRQKILLDLLDTLPTAPGRTALVKLVFLLRQEVPSLASEAFYDFLPYKFGPFSFCLYRELENLRSKGYLGDDETSVILDARTRGERANIVDSIPERIRRGIKSVSGRYGGMRYRELLAKVYRAYPWYATRSEKRRLVASNAVPAPSPSVAVYTVGYEGTSVDSFFDYLLRKGIKGILDVRANPVSRKYGFARRSLNDIATKLGCDYHHIPGLGIPSSHRVGLSSYEAYQRLLDRYELDMLPKCQADLRLAADLLGQEPSALLCVEKDPRLCHPGRLAKSLEAITGLPVINLTA